MHYFVELSLGVSHWIKHDGVTGAPVIELKYKQNHFAVLEEVYMATYK